MKPPKLEIYEICCNFEIKHAPEVIVSVHKGTHKDNYIISMAAMTVSARGNLNEEVSAVVAWDPVRKSKKELAKYILDTCESLYCDLYETP